MTNEMYAKLDMAEDCALTAIKTIYEAATWSKMPAFGGAVIDTGSTSEDSIYAYLEGYELDILTLNQLRDLLAALREKIDPDAQLTWENADELEGARITMMANPQDFPPFSGEYFHDFLERIEGKKNSRRCMPRREGVIAPLGLLHRGVQRLTTPTPAP